MHYFTGALAVIALIGIGVFSVQNLEIVEVDFLFWSVRISKVLVILGSYVLGMITGWGVIGLARKYLQS